MPISPWNRKRPRLREIRNGNAQFSFCLMPDSKMPNAATRSAFLFLAFGFRHSRFGIPLGGIAQLVERQLCKLDVRGSNPLASSLRNERNEGEGCHAGVKTKAGLLWRLLRAQRLRLGRPVTSRCQARSDLETLEILDSRPGIKDDDSLLRGDSFARYKRS